MQHVFFIHISIITFELQFPALSSPVQHKATGYKRLCHYQSSTTTTTTIIAITIRYN
ncbi:hypothetical protein Hanom_Chr02g00177381 [Helianthus anomalus]